MTSYIILRSPIADVMEETTVNCKCHFTEKIDTIEDNLNESESKDADSVIYHDRETESSKNNCCCTIRRKFSQTRCCLSFKPKEKEVSELSKKLSMYTEDGPFLTHLPQFSDAANLFKALHQN